MKMVLLQRADTVLIRRHEFVDYESFQLLESDIAGFECRIGTYEPLDITQDEVLERQLFIAVFREDDGNGEDDVLLPVTGFTKREEFVDGSVKIRYDVRCMGFESYLKARVLVGFANGGGTVPALFRKALIANHRGLPVVRQAVRNETGSAETTEVSGDWGELKKYLTELCVDKELGYRWDWEQGDPNTQTNADVVLAIYARKDRRFGSANYDGALSVENGSLEYTLSEVNTSDYRNKAFIVGEKDSAGNRVMVQTQATSPLPPDPVQPPTMPSWPGVNYKVGTRGANVSFIQECLTVIAKSYPSIPAIGSFGSFNSQTKKAVQEFQRLFGLKVDGIVGVKTWPKIMEIYSLVTQDIVPQPVPLGTPSEVYEIYIDASGTRSEVSIETDTGTKDAQGNPIFDSTKKLLTPYEYKRVLHDQAAEKLRETTRSLLLEAKSGQGDQSKVKVGSIYTGFIDGVETDILVRQKITVMELTVSYEYILEVIKDGTTESLAG